VRILYHDGPIFDNGSKLRPADLLEMCRCHPAGCAIDVTIGSAVVSSAEARETHKSDFYRSQVAAHKGLEFAPFAADSSGMLGPRAIKRMRDWSISLVALRSATRVPAGSPALEVDTAVGVAFASACVAALSIQMKPPVITMRSPGL